MNQIFDITFRSFDRRKLQRLYLKSYGNGIFCHFLNHFNMSTFFPDHSFFTDFLTPRLKLWFDQCHDFPIIFQIIPDRKEHLGKGNEGDIDGRKINRLAEIFRNHIADIGLLHADNTLILS